MKHKVRQDKFMQEEYKVKLGRDGSIVAHMPLGGKKTVEKVRTKQSDELNFYIPEKWNYNQII